MLIAYSKKMCMVATANNYYYINISIKLNLSSWLWNTEALESLDHR